MVVPSHNKYGESSKDEFKQETNAQPGSKGERMEQNLRKDKTEDKLKDTVIDVNRDEVDKGKVMSEALNNNISSFMPDMMMDKLVNNFKEAKEIYGDSLIREMSGYDSGYVERNMKIPEFRKDIEENMKSNIDTLKDAGLVDKEGFITEKGYDVSAVALMMDELDDLQGKGLLGDKKSKEKSLFGDRKGFRHYKNSDSYKSINIRQSVRKAVRRGRKNLIQEDFMIEEKDAKGNLEVIYAIDSSGSMKGDKIKVAKKAGVALGYEASKNKDKTGLIVFDSEVHTSIEPTKDFERIVRSLARIKTGGETDLTLCLSEAIRMFSGKRSKKHLVILTDALHTKGERPEETVLQYVGKAVEENITITVIGIKLNPKGESMARKVVDHSQGRLYVVSELKNIDGLMLQDYYSIKNA